MSTIQPISALPPMLLYSRSMHFSTMFASTLAVDVELGRAGRSCKMLSWLSGRGSMSRITIVLLH
jgi:hypothetical protein